MELWWRNKVSHFKRFFAYAQNDRQGEALQRRKKKEERKKKNGGGETMFRILLFYIFISTFYIDTVISTEAERSF